jgi:hypothetical protein
MLDVLDMNSQRIINIAEPVGSNDAARLLDVQNAGLLGENLVDGELIFGLGGLVSSNPRLFWDDGNQALFVGPGAFDDDQYSLYIRAKQSEGRSAFLISSDKGASPSSFLRAIQFSNEANDLSYGGVGISSTTWRLGMGNGINLSLAANRQDIILENAVSDGLVNMKVHGQGAGRDGFVEFPLTDNYNAIPRKLRIGNVFGNDEGVLEIDKDVNDSIRLRGYKGNGGLGFTLDSELQGLIAATHMNTGSAAAYGTLTAHLIEFYYNNSIVADMNNISFNYSGSYISGAPSGGTSRPWKFGQAAVVSPTSPNRTIEVEVNGTTYYIAAKTTND